MEEPILLLGRVANFRACLDEHLEPKKFWWLDVGMFILEVTDSKSGRFTGKLYWGSGNTSLELDTREAACAWVEQQAHRRAREMVDLANMTG